MSRYIVSVKYTSEYQYEVWADGKAAAIKVAKEVSSPVDNQDFDFAKEFKWTTARARKQKCP